MEMALSFNEVQFDVIDRNGESWVRVSQIATALGYASAQRVIELFTRHADEFSNSMTALVKLPTEGGEQEVRIFSLRGCHLLAMFARTPVAKEFRKWVLDVLDRIAKEERNPPLPYVSISPSQQAELKALVDAKLSPYPANMQRKVRGELWSRFNRRFCLGKYSQLSPDQMDEAKEYIIDMELRSAPAPEEPIQIDDSLSAREMRNLISFTIGVGNGWKKAFEACFNAARHTQDIQAAPEMDKPLQDILSELAEIEQRVGNLTGCINGAFKNSVMHYAGSEEKQRAFYALQHLRRTAIDALYMAQNSLIAAWNLGHGVNFN